MMRFIILFFVILLKNLKIIFRNWTTLCVLIIGPLLLTLIVGFAFGGEELHHVTLGIVSTQDTITRHFMQQFQQQDLTIVLFELLPACLKKLELSQVHLCIEFSPNFQLAALGNNTLILHYDPTRFTLSKQLLQQVHTTILNTSQQVSLDAAQGILRDVDHTIVTLQNIKVQVQQFINYSTTLREELVVLNDTLDTLHDQFMSHYDSLQKTRTSLSSAISNINQTQQHLKDTLTGLSLMLTQFSDESSALMAHLSRVDALVSSYNNQVDTLSLFSQSHNASDAVLTSLSALKLNISQLETPINQTLLNKTQETISAASELLNSLEQQTRTQGEFIHQVELFLADIDQVQSLWDIAQHRLDEHIHRLDLTAEQLLLIDTQLDYFINQLSSIDQVHAEKLLHPFIVEEHPVLEGLRKINLIFPVLLVFVISFISILLANILVSNEITSAAYFRNFLAPTPSILFHLGLFATTLLLVSFQLLVLCIVAYVKFKISIFTALGPFIVITLLLMVLFVQMGMIFAYTLKVRHNALLISTFVALGLFLFSDIIFPLETMPPLASTLAAWNPLVAGEHLYRMTLFYGVPLSTQPSYLSVLIIATSIFVVFALAAHYIHKNRLN